MSVRVDVTGDDHALEDLWEWLGSERELRGRMRWESPPPAEGTMGSGVEIAVQVTELGFAGINTLVAAVGAWLTYRRTQPVPPVAGVTITAPDGTRVEMANPDAAALERVIQALSEDSHGTDDPAA